MPSRVSRRRDWHCGTAKYCPYCKVPGGNENMPHRQRISIARRKNISDLHVASALEQAAGLPVLPGLENMTDFFGETSIDNDEYLVANAAQNQHGVAGWLIFADLLQRVDRACGRLIHLADLRDFYSVCLVTHACLIRSVLAFSYSRSTCSGI